MVEGELTASLRIWLGYQNTVFFEYCKGKFKGTKGKDLKPLFYISFILVRFASYN